MSTGTTPKGYPFPNGDDPVVNGDNMIQALARAIDTNVGRIASGTALIPVGDPGSVVVQYPAGRFNAAPRCFVTAAVTANLDNMTVAAASSSSATQVTISAHRRTGGTQLSIWWLAVLV